MSFGSPLTSLSAPLPLPPHVPLAAVLPKVPPCHPSPSGGPTVPAQQKVPQGTDTGGGDWCWPDKDLCQWLCEGEQWCAHAESYCYCWPSPLCPFPKLMPWPSQQLMIRTSERKASSPAMIKARMTQVDDLFWKLEWVFLYILNIYINT